MRRQVDMLLRLTWQPAS